MTSRYLHDNLVVEADNSEDARVKVINKTRTAAGLLVGVLIGITWGLASRAYQLGVLVLQVFQHSLFIFSILLNAAVTSK